MLHKHNTGLFLGYSSVQAESSRASVVRPYRRPTAQEMCYQRMQMAQQQAEQLAVAVKAAASSSSSSSSSSFPGEKKRVAHRPNPSALSVKSKCVMFSYMLSQIAIWQRKLYLHLQYVRFHVRIYLLM